MIVGAGDAPGLSNPRYADIQTSGLPPSSSPLGIRTTSKADDDVPYIAWDSTAPYPEEPDDLLSLACPDCGGFACAGACGDDDLYRAAMSARKGKTQPEVNDEFALFCAELDAWIARTDAGARDAELQRVLRETEALLISTGAGEQRREGL